MLCSHVPEQAWWCSGSARVRYHQGPGRAEPHGKPNVLAETMVTCRVRDSKEFEMCRERECVTIKIFRCIKIDGSGGARRVFAAT